MKLTQLVIGPKEPWNSNSPCVCTVKLASETATVETILSHDDMQRMLDLVQSIVADAAERNVAAFVGAIRTVEADKIKVLS